MFRLPNSGHFRQVTNAFVSLMSNHSQNLSVNFIVVVFAAVSVVVVFNFTKTTTNVSQYKNTSISF